MIRRLILLALVSGLAAAACTSPGGGAPEVDVEGLSFRSVSTEGFTFVEGTRLELGFTDGNINAKAGCNSMFAGYSLDGDILHVSALASTAIGCEDSLQEQDMLIEELLTSEPQVAVEGDDLIISGKAGQEQVRITLEQVPQAGITGTTWRLTGTVKNEGVHSLPPGVESTMTIEDGRAQFDYGCNTGFGEVTVGEGTLEFGPLAGTRKMCPEQVMEVENHIMTVLAGDVNFAIDGDSLHIDNGDIGLRYHAE